MEQDANDRLLANAISFLIDGQEFYEASILLLCKLYMHTSDPYFNDANAPLSVKIELTVNRAIYEIIQREEHPATIAIWQAFRAVLTSDYFLESLYARVEMLNFDADWRSKLLEVVESKVPLNQCLPIQNKPRYPWENLLFRSTYEITIAKALNEYKVLFLPNCMARFSSPVSAERKNREADFLVCCDGKWGIIEVDGETTHPSAAKDHDRDRLFRTYGIRVIERYTANQCLNNPKGVVQQFLLLLEKNG